MDKDIEHIFELNLEPKRPDDDWLQERLGKITGSQVSKIVKRTKDKKGWELSNGKVCDDLLYKIAWERFLTNESNGFNRLNISSKEMEHGNDYEGEAIIKYTEHTGVEVDYSQKYLELTDYFGGTPDGFVGDDGIIEVKCPWNGGNHLRSLFTGEVYNPDYYMQIQSYLLITGRVWCDFVTYDPDMPDGINISINKVERDEDLIFAISQIIEKANEIIQGIYNKLKDKLDDK